MNEISNELQWKRIVGLSLAALLLVLFAVTRLTGDDPDEGAIAEVQPTVRPESAPDTRARTFEQYFSENFSGTSWYDSVTDYGIQSDHIVISTSLFPDDEGEEFATPICMAASSYVFSNTNTSGLEGVIVNGQDDTRIVRRSSMSDSC